MLLQNLIFTRRNLTVLLFVQDRVFINLSKCFKIRVQRLGLMRNKAYINGEWVEAISCKTFDVVNPATQEVIGVVPHMAEDDVQNAITSAYCAFPDWSNLTSKNRSDYLRKWNNLMQEHFDDLAQIVTLESGKTLTEAKCEIAYGNSFIEWYSEEARRVYGEILQSPTRLKHMILIKQPIGVVAAITPWNFPHAMIARTSGALLAAGCTCIIKPAEDTPYTALAMCDLAEKAGIPKGVINIVTTDGGNAGPVCKEMCDSNMVSGVSFTGSTEVGRLLYKQCAPTIKRLHLELGGNAPFIVFKSADIDSAVNGAMAAKFRNSGQACISVNRVLLEEGIFDSFVCKLKDKMSKLKLGRGTQPSVDQGPLINKIHFKKVDIIVKDAVSKGATLVYGGEPAKDVGELFYKPTLLTDITPDMLCYNEEIFGPVVACIIFKTEEEALAISNNTRSGLVGYFYSSDIKQIWRVQKRLEVGMVGVNESLLSAAEIAFGGIKESGIGRAGSHYGIEEYLYIKYICYGNVE